MADDFDERAKPASDNANRLVFVAQRLILCCYLKCSEIIKLADINDDHGAKSKKFQSFQRSEFSI